MPNFFFGLGVRLLTTGSLPPHQEFEELMANLGRAVVASVLDVGL